MISITQKNVEAMQSLADSVQKMLAQRNFRTQPRKNKYIICYQCQGKGHIQRNGPLTSSSSQPVSNSTPARINNWQSVRKLLRTGHAANTPVLAQQFPQATVGISE